MKSKLDGIVIFCYSGDFWLTKICVASIRYWYPDFPIFIVKDIFAGEFDTDELTKNWNVQILKLEREKFGSPFAKIFLNFLNDGKKYLILDSDVAFTGKVLDKFYLSDTDFTVHKEIHNAVESRWFEKTYYNYRRVKEMDPNYKYPGFSFNTGALIITTGKLSQEEFKHVVYFDGKLKEKDSTTFPLYDQSIYNYLLPKLVQEKKITLSGEDFQIWGNKKNLEEFSIEDIRKKNEKPFLIHWAGTVKPLLREMSGGDILQFYRSYYYSAIPFGSYKHLQERIKRELRWGLLFKTGINIKKKVVENSSTKKRI